MAKPRLYPVGDITVPENCDGCPFRQGEVAAAAIFLEQDTRV